MSNTPMDPFNAEIKDVDDVVQALYTLLGSPGMKAVDATVSQYRIDLSKAKAEIEQLRRDIFIDRMGMDDQWCNQCSRFKRVRGRDTCGLCLAAHLSTVVDELYVDKAKLKETQMHLCEFTDRTIAAETIVGNLRKALHEISLCSVNSASSREEMGRIARDAIAQNAEDK
jgi:hypothetical protein